MDLDTRPNSLQRWLQWIPMSRPGVWIFSRSLHLMDIAVYRLTGGKTTVSSLVSGLPILLLTTTGAKSRQKHTIPLMGVPHGDAIILIASNFGQPHHPAWYYNLKKHPECEIKTGNRQGVYMARQVTGEERKILWSKAAAIYEGYNIYKVRAGREIAVFLMEPKHE